jgi:hypothetical protein
LPFDLIGWTEATPGTGTVKLAGGLGDNLYSVNGDDITLKGAQKYYALLGVLYHAVSTGARALLRQPSLHLDHEFIKCALSADLDPSQGMHWFPNRPLPLYGNEKLNALSVNATDEINMVGAWIGDKQIPNASLDLMPTQRITGYADVTVTAHTWTDVAITWNQDLPVGKYIPVGMRASIFKASGPTIALARLVIPGNNDWRPGVPMAVAEADHEEFQSVTHDPWSKWHEMPELIFTNTLMPNIEVLSTVASTDENVELLIKKVG